MGPTLSGKSTWLRQTYFMSRHIAANPRLVIDPVGSDLSIVPGATTVWEPTGLPFPDRGAPCWRFVPKDPFDLDSYDALHREIERMIRRGVIASIWEWIDETHVVLPSAGGKPAPKKAVFAGAKLSWGMGLATVRLSGSDPVVRTQAEVIALFGSVGEADMSDLAQEMRMRRDDLYAAVAALEPHACLVWRRSLGTVHHLEPVAS